MDVAEGTAAPVALSTAPHDAVPPQHCSLQITITNSNHHVPPLALC